MKRGIGLKVSSKYFYTASTFLLLVLLILTSLGFATGSWDGFVSQLDETIEQSMEFYSIPGVSIAVIDNNEIVWSKAYGYADLDRKRPMTIDTPCRAESISKSVTAWGVMKLVEEGRLELDDPVVNFLGDWSFPAGEFALEDVTVGQLLSHRSGLQLGTIGVHYAPAGWVPSLEENLLKETRLIQEPDAGFFYSNVGYNLLELVIQNVTGVSFAEYMDQEILDPLGMDNATFVWREDITPQLPTGYDLDGNAVPAYVYPEKASGGLIATVEDIAKFGIAGMLTSGNSGGVLKLDSVNQLYTETSSRPGIYGLVSDGYGMGFFLESLSGQTRAVFNGGQGHGWMTHLHLLPTEGKGIVILTNSQRSWPLVSRILTEWSNWVGVSSVGMGRIAQGAKLMWLAIGLILALSVFATLRVIYLVYQGKRRFAPLGVKRMWRGAQAVLAVILLSILLWASGQDYLFISSVFPVAHRWLGYSLLSMSLHLLLSATVVPSSSFKGSNKDNWVNIKNY